MIKHPRAPQIKELIWIMPPPGWLKWNCDGAYNQDLIPTVWGGIFCNKIGNFLLAFVDQFLWSSSLIVDFFPVIMAMKIVKDKAWTKLWIKMDSLNMVQVFHSNSLVPWKIKHQWIKNISYVAHTNLFISQNYIEENACVDHMTNLGLTCNFLAIFEFIHMGIRKYFVKKRLRMPFLYRFLSFWWATFGLPSSCKACFFNIWDFHLKTEEFLIPTYGVKKHPKENPKCLSNFGDASHEAPYLKSKG